MITIVHFKGMIENDPYPYYVIVTGEHRYRHFEELPQGFAEGYDSKAPRWLLNSEMGDWLEESSIDYSLVDVQSGTRRFPEIYLKNAEDVVTFKMRWV